MRARRIASLLLSMILCITMMPISVFADETGGTSPTEPTMKVVNIEVSDDSTDNDDYKIDGECIILRKRDVKYELSGTTDKEIRLWGSNDAEDIDQAFYMVLNNVTVNGGINVVNSPVKMVIDVPEGSENTVSKVRANDLTITGKGVINATDLDVIQKTSYMPSALCIKDATVNVNCRSNAGDSCEWNGVCVLEGDAKVTYISNSNYAALKIGVKSGDNTHSLTIKENAKLYCLQGINEPSSSCVNGLEIFSTDLTLDDNAYLEAEGRDTTGKYLSSGIMSQGNITIKKNASIKVASQGVAVSTWGNINIQGGTVLADSSLSNGIYADGSITIYNAKVDAKGYLPAIFSNGKMNISNSNIKGQSSNDVAVFSRDAITVNNSLVRASAATDYDGIGGDKGVSVTSSWIETSGPESFDGENTGVLFNNFSADNPAGEATVKGNLAINDDVTIGENMTLIIPADTTLTVSPGKNFTNNGTVKVEGSFTNSGTVVCTKHTGGQATTTEKAKCAICGVEYGELLSSGGHYVPTQRPDVKSNEGGKTELSNNGKTLTITPDEGKEVEKILVNGEDRGAVTEITGLRTGDKVEIFFKDKVPTKEELDAAAKDILKNASRRITIWRTSKKSIRVTAVGDLSELIEKGYVVKYTFYKKAPGADKYRAIKTTENNKYNYTKLKKGINKFQVKIRIYDKDGNFVASGWTYYRAAKTKA